MSYNLNMKDEELRPKESDKNSIWRNKKFRWLFIGIAAVAPLEILSFFSVGLPVWFELPLLLAAILVFGRSVFLSGLKSIAKLNFSDINFLMTVAVAGAVYLRQFEEGVIVVILFSLGEALEEYGIEKSKGALEQLTASFPKTAQAKGEAKRRPLGEVGIGEIIVVKPGDTIPLDGEVATGNSLVDEAIITGEPLPKSKSPGDPVYAGTQNSSGYLELKVLKKSEDTALSKIIELTYQSAEKKSASQKFIEKFAKYYTPSVIVISAMIVIVPVFVFEKSFDFWLAQALTILVISCPCALVMATPVAVFSAIGNAIQKGAVIKGGKFLEELARVKAIAFDKTRTLTEGNPFVSDVIPYNGFSENELLACAAGMEVFSEHPIAKSIMKKAEEKNIEFHSFNGFQSVRGKGIKGNCAVCDDVAHCLGNLNFIREENGKELEDYIAQKVRQLEAQGKTAMIISDERQVKGIFGVSDKIREESAGAIKAIKRLGIKTLMFTGDNKNAAREVGRQLGIDEIQAELLPQDKVGKIEEYMKKYKNVAMVGDGVNDAPALARSSVGITLGAIGSDLAVENADIVLMNDKLSFIPYLIKLGRKCASKIRFNIALAVVIKALFVMLAVRGLSNLALAIFADVGVTLIVVANSLYLYKFGEKR